MTFVSFLGRSAEGLGFARECAPNVWVETCFEPRSNLFDATTIGKPVQIELFAERWPSRAPEYTLELLTWVPEN